MWSFWTIFVLWMWYMLVFECMFPCVQFKQERLMSGVFLDLSTLFFEIRCLNELRNQQLVNWPTNGLQEFYYLYTLPRLRLKGASHQPQPFHGYWWWTLVLYGQQIIYHLRNIPGLRFNIFEYGWMVWKDEPGHYFQVLNFITYLI